MTTNPYFVAATGVRGTNPTVPTPMGVEDKDLLLLVLWQYSTGTYTAPSAPWVPLFSVSPSAGQVKGIHGFTRFASSEGANLGTITANGGTYITPLAYRVVDPEGTIVVGDLGHQSPGDATLTLPEVTTTEDNSTLLALAAIANTVATMTAAPGMTEELDDEAGTFMRVQVADEALGTAGATGVRVVTYSTTLLDKSGLLLALPPVPPPPPETVEFTGTGVSISVGDGGIGRRRGVEGTGVSGVAATGTLLALRPFTGVGTSLTAAAGVMVRRAGMAGAGVGVVAANGVMGAVRGLAGTGGSVSAGSGALRLARSLSGVGTSVTGAAGTFSRVRGLAGVGVSVTRGIGHMIGPVLLSGIGVSVSAAAGALRARRGLSGAGVNETRPAGALRVRRDLRGDGRAVSSASGAVSRVRGLAGMGSSETAGSGALTALVSFAGVGVSVVRGVGAVVVRFGGHYVFGAAGSIRGGADGQGGVSGGSNRSGGASNRFER